MAITKDDEEMYVYYKAICYDRLCFRREKSRIDIRAHQWEAHASARGKVAKTQWVGQKGRHTKQGNAYFTLNGR